MATVSKRWAKELVVLRRFVSSGRSRSYSTDRAQSEHSEHLFQPVASQPSVSPMRRTTTWLTALRAREKHQQDWINSHSPSEKPPPLDSYSYTSVKTTDVVEKSRHDSFTYVILPFKSDQWFLDAYINSSGRLRIGQIFQDLDALAGVIAYRHCSPAEPVIVTASVDRIYMLKRLDNISQFDVTLSGSVTWTGRSSMEITIKAATHSKHINPGVPLEEADIVDDDVFLTANFTFVARDPSTKKSFAINKLVPKTPEQKRDFIRAEEYNARKKEIAQKTALTLTPPSEQEAGIIHEMWAKDKVVYSSSPELKPKDLLNMEDTRIFSTSIMQPQYRNRHSYMIFGGYLLRQTFELAYACAAAFSHGAPRFVSLDSTTFRAPVPVGSVLYLTATVAYTEHINREYPEEAGDPPLDPNEHRQKAPGTLIQIRVDSTVKNLEHGTTTNTGQFTYSYFVAGRFLLVQPQSYNEMMEYLEGRRKAIETANFARSNQIASAPDGVVSE